MIVQGLSRLRAGLVALFLAAVPASAVAGEVILTIDGAITAGAAGQQAVSFDLDQLMALPSRRFRTGTIWTEGVQEFSGVPLKALLAEVGVTDGTVLARALNDYAVKIPVDSLGDEAPIVAYMIDGATFSRREKGPLWIVYPYDSSRDFQTETVYGRSVWQLSRLTVE